jgi:hypothetical protein
MTWRQSPAMDFKVLAAPLLVWLFGYAAWLTSIVFCAANGLWLLLMAGAAFFPIWIIHGVGIWFGGW